MPSRYVIGIDLGTSNCSLSYIDTLAASAKTQVLPLPQLESFSAVANEELLPSFLYLPPQGEEPAGVWGGNDSKVVGRFARSQTAVLPGRVIASAKSWLASDVHDREEAFLPWGSTEVTTKLSPVAVEAAYLKHLRKAWNQSLGAFAEEYRFEHQQVTVTVPASFDEAAQVLTLKAARLAGYPPDVRLLEEPQAAFYYWLEAHAASTRRGFAQSLLELLPALRDEAQTVLICDIGGGTSDFSLFELQPPQPDGEVAISRVAVSDHILLAGDNIDLALAMALEQNLTAQGHTRTLSPRQQRYLVFQARALKEKALSSEGAGDELFHVAIPGEGASLMASAVRASLSRAAATALILEGFFPWVKGSEKPRKPPVGLKEMGLPYAFDSAVTRHLAGFLRGRPVDAVLFTGGTLKPAFLRDRLSEQIARWQGGRAPAALVNAQMDLAVAHGAAYYGWVLRQPAGRIKGGYPHALYLELYKEATAAKPDLVCIMPKGFEAGHQLALKQVHFKLLLGRVVRFQLYYSNRRDSDRAGDVVALDEDFTPLPPLQTELNLPGGVARPTDDLLDVQLDVNLNETGMMQLFLSHESPAFKERWELDFNLRRKDLARGSQGQGVEDIGVNRRRFEEAAERIALFYGKKRLAGLQESPKNLTRELENILGLERQHWPVGLLRSLWPSLVPGVTSRSRSAAHETAWLYLAGYTLRPGYGADLDPWRISELWRCFSVGLYFPKEANVILQWWIMWRRVAGGLDAVQQTQLMGRILPLIRKRGSATPELVMLAASLERVELKTRIELGNVLVRQLLDRSVLAVEQSMAALGRLASRVPLYSDVTNTVPAAQVGEWVAKLSKVDLTKRGYKSLALFLAMACRMTNDVSRDVSPSVRTQALALLQQLGASEEQKQVVRDFVPVDLAARARLFGEALPSGLVLITD